MSKALDIIPECFVDTNLIGWLIGTGVNHQYGCNRVSAAMQGGKMKDGFAVGIVDDDKQKSKYINEFQSIASSPHLEVLKHPDKHHYFILVKKAAEDFILSVAREVGFDMTVAGLSNDLEGLKKTTKDCQSNEDKSLRNAFGQIKNASEMKIFRNTLKYLETHRYNADMKVLRGIFANPDYDIWTVS